MDGEEGDHYVDMPRKDAVRVTIAVCVVILTVVLVAYLVVTSPLCSLVSDGSYNAVMGRCYVPRGG